jgi:Alginate lyase
MENSDSFHRSLRRLYIIFFLLGALVTTALAQDSLLTKSDIIKLDLKTLAEKRIKVRSKDPGLMPAYEQLLRDADQLLDDAPVSVMQKAGFPPSGDKHDYMSIAPYFWPDSSKPDGLPYVNRDGVVNPEVRKYTDKLNLSILCENIYLLSLAYYFSNDEKYAMHASKLTEVWFLDPATRMNPNLNYGQAVKGITEGRAEGLMDSRFFIWAIDGVRLLQTSRFWTPRDQSSLKEWFSAFLNWMQTSEIGQKEMNAKNNHGVWYDAQALTMALFVDSLDLADKIVQRAASRLDQQMDTSGLFPLELTRTTSLHYSVFILNAFTVVAQLSEQTHMNLWRVESPSGKSLKKGFQAILPYVIREKPWPWPQIHEFNYYNAVPILVADKSKFQCSSCTNALQQIEGKDYQRCLFVLL